MSLLTWKLSGQTTDLGPGDSMHVRDGSRVRWEVVEDVTKVFFGHKVDHF
jgi:uncharacterized cupin superfamily protein